MEQSKGKESAPVLTKIPCYRIRWWNEIYENNRTRDLKEMKWVPIPIKLSGDGYTSIMEDQKNGPAIFGAWIACVEVAASCDPRGTLLRSSGEPHNMASIGRICRVNLQILKMMMDFVLFKIKWIEIIDLKTNTVVPHEDAEFPHLHAALYCTVFSSIPCPVKREDWREGKQQYLKNVWLTTDEYQRFETRLGKRFMDRCIEKLNDMIENSQTGRKYTNHAAAIRSWVINSVKKEGLNPEPVKKIIPLPPFEPPPTAEQLAAWRETLPDSIRKKMKAG
jgi:hypothetical protein